VDVPLVPIVLTCIGAVGLIAALGLHMRDRRKQPASRAVRWPTGVVAVALLDGLWTELGSTAREDTRIDDALADLEQAVTQPSEPGSEGPRSAKPTPVQEAIDIEVPSKAPVLADRRRRAMRTLRVDPLRAYLETLRRPAEPDRVSR